MTDKARDGMKPVLEYGYNYKTNTSETLAAFRQAPDLTTKAQVAAGFVASNLSGDMGDRQDVVKFDKNGPAILWVNGMWTDTERSKGTARKLREDLNVQIARIENNTHAFPLQDGLQALGHETGMVDITAIRAADAMRQGLQSYGEVYVIAHSQGAAVFHQGLPLLTADEKKHIHYQGYGGQMNIDAKKVGIAEAINVRYEKDYVPYLANDLKNATFKYLGNLAQPAKCFETTNWEAIVDRKKWIYKPYDSEKPGDVHDFDYRYKNGVKKQWGQ
jgi:hypothetical protein